MIEMPGEAALNQIAQVASEADAPVTANQVAAVLSAYCAILDGDPVGTIRRNPDTGELAVRVNADGLHLWRVSHPQGGQYNDLQPTLPWPTIAGP
jgi:hypothetical protein